MVEIECAIEGSVTADMMVVDETVEALSRIASEYATERSPDRLVGRVTAGRFASWVERV